MVQYTTPENEDLRRQGILEMAATAAPAPPPRQPTRTVTTEALPVLRRPGQLQGYTPPPPPPPPQGAPQREVGGGEVPLLRRPGYPQVGFSLSYEAYN